MHGVGVGIGLGVGVGFWAQKAIWPLSGGITNVTFIFVLTEMKVNYGKNLKVIIIA